MYYGLNFIDLAQKNKKQQKHYDNSSSTVKSIIIKEHVSYIGRIEGAENNGEHSLFGTLQGQDNVSERKKIDILNEISEKVRNGADVYKTILSLKEDEAEKFGFVTKQSWENMIRSNIDVIAREYNIPIENLDWVASMHTEEGHIHCHLVFYDNEKPRTSIPFVKYQNIKKEFNKDIFRGELEKIYEVQNTSKKEIKEVVKDELSQFSFYDKTKMFNNKLSKDEVKNIIEKLTAIAVKKEEEYKKTKKGSWKMQYQSPEIKKDIRNATLEIVKSSKAIKETINNYIKSNIEAEKLKNIYLSDKQYNIINKKAEEFMQKKIDNQILQFLKEQKQEKRNLKLEEYQKIREDYQKKEKEYYRQAVGRDLGKLLSVIYSDTYNTSKLQSALSKKTKIRNETKMSRREEYFKNRDKGFIDWEEQ